MTAEFFKRLRLLDEVFDGVHRAGGVANGALRVLAGLEHRLDGDLEVAHIVHRIEDAEHVHAVPRRLLHERLDHVVGVVPITEQVLAAQQHLDRRVRQRGFQLAQPFPRIFLQESQAGVERGAAPGLERPETGVVELGARREHVGGAHARRQ